MGCRALIYNRFRCQQNWPLAGTNAKNRRISEAFVSGMAIFSPPVLSLQLDRFRMLLAGDF
jgi:hypothetical protein